jgi:putative transposase
MARQPRLCSPGNAHLVQLQATPGVQPLADAAQRDQFLRWMRDGLQAGALRLHAYAVLPQAVWLLLTPQTAAQLSTFVQGLARRTSRALGRASPDPAPVWAGRFRSAVVQPGQWELAAMVWIDRAAERADSLAAADWRWSSRAAHCGEAQVGSGAPPLSLPAVYWALGNTPFEREAAYRERLRQGLERATESALERALRSGTAVGDSAFLQQIEASSGRRVLPAPRGRPRKSSPKSE